MTVTVTYRGADGAVREQATELLRPCGRRSDFFCFNVAEDIVAEFLWAAKKLLFGTGQRDGSAKFKFDQMKGADEIGKLEQAVASRLYILGEFDLTVYFVFKYLVEHPSDRCLSAIVVDLDTLDRCKKAAVRKYKVSKVGSEAVENLICGVHEFLVHTEAMVSVGDLAGKCHHAREDAASQLPTQHGIVLFTADERPCVEAMPLKANFAVGAFKDGDVLGYVNGLVVEHHADNVETGFPVGDAEVSRFVHEYAQGFCFHSVPSQKREWRDTNPATHAESFPRIPVTPSRGKKSVCIIANRGCGCNGGNAKLFNVQFFRRSA